MLDLKKPVALEDEFWSGIATKVSDAYVRTALGRVLLFETNKLVTQLKAARPSGVLAEHWDSYSDEVSRRCAVAALASMDNSARAWDESAIRELRGGDGMVIMDALYRKRMSALPDLTSLAGATQFIAEVKPAWIKESDYRELQRQAHRRIEIEKNQIRYSACLSLMNLIVSGQELPTTMPDGVSEDDWRKLGHIEEQVVTVAKTNRSKQQELTDIDTKLAADRARVLKQLSVIHECLRDPTALDRLEDFEEVFAPGNLANLRLLVTMHGSRSEQRAQVG